MLRISEYHTANEQIFCANLVRLNNSVLPKKIIISVTSDLVTDQRVHRTANTLTKAGHSVVLVGRKLKNSQPLDSRNYKTHRFNLLFEKGALFYSAYNIRLFFYLLFNRAEVLLANDLDTLPANFLASKINNSKLVYDSHEYYTGVPELEHRPLIQKIWKAIEKFIFPKLNFVYTVNDSIASLYEDEYHKKVAVVRNIPDIPVTSLLPDKEKIRRELGIAAGCKIIILQGAGINIERGAEEAVESMNYIDNAVLLIVGGGDVIPFLKEIVQQSNLQSKVFFINKMPFVQLLQYTRAADVGLTLDKDTNINYRFSLPNKLFDYIHANVPVLGSPLIEVKKIITQYDIGAVIENHDPENIASKIRFMLADENRIAEWKKNLEIAANELSWENEERKLLNVFNNAL